MKTLTVSFIILAFALSASPAIFAGDKTAETNAANNERSAKVARAKAKSRAQAKKAGKQKSSYGNADKVVTDQDCGANVDIGNVNTGGGRVTGNVNNEVIITGDIINISKGGCKR